MILSDKILLQKKSKNLEELKGNNSFGVIFP